MSEKLLPCPFCGNTNIVLKDNGIGDVYAICEGDDESGWCGARSSDHSCETDAKAIRRWNTRSNPSHAQLTAERSALEKIADPDFWAVDPYGSDEEVNGRRADRGDAAYELAVSTVSTLAQEPAGQSEAHVATAWRVCWVSLNTRCTELFEGQTAAYQKANETGGAVIPLYVHPTVPAGSASPGVTAATKLREATVDVLTSLVATLSILRRAQEQKRKPSLAVASDNMFEQMLKDYDAPVERARNILAAHPIMKVSGDAAEMRERAAKWHDEQAEHCEATATQWRNSPRTDDEARLWTIRYARDASTHRMSAETIRALPLTPDSAK